MTFLKQNWIVVIISLLIVGNSFLFQQNRNPAANLASIGSIEEVAKATLSPTATPTSREGTQILYPPRNVDLVGVAVAIMTYGRILVRNLTPDTSFSYFIAEPSDVVTDGGLRYSPTTENIGEEPIRIIGKMSDQCFWDLEEYYGCVPWVEIEKVEPTDINPQHYVSNFKDLRWWTKKIYETNLYADVVIEYPQFIGGDEVLALNNYIRDQIHERLDEDRAYVEELKSDVGDRWDETCGQEPFHETLWSCSVILYSEYRVVSIVNDIVSIELIITDFTGGGNGNHDEAIIINWDLKKNRILDVRELFCDQDYVSKLLPLANKGLRNSFADPDSIPEDAVWIDREDIKAEDESNILIGYEGLTVVFQPYSVLSGADGIVRTPINYSSIPGTVCLP